MNGDIVMNTTAINRVDVLEKVKRKELKQKKAAEVLGLSVRQIRRLVRKYKHEGIKGLVHQAKGKVSNNKVSQRILDEAMRIVKEKYWDFGPTLAHEKLVEEHGNMISVERIRQEMIVVGLWKNAQRRKAQIHQLRERRACFGELFQLDGSPHDWFEGRGPTCNLNVDIDDATGIFLIEFSPSETTQGYFSLVEKHLVTYGVPVALYADKHSIFQVNTPTNLDHKKPSRSDQRSGLTQFGRAMKELGIELIPANTPQAKGRVEHINGTLQDRLVKELRLQNISTIEAANLFLPAFTKKYCAKFSVPPRSKVDMHRKVSAGLDLSKILCIKETRVLSKNLTCQYQDMIYQIKTKRSAYALRKMVVTIRERYNGSVTICDNRGKLLEFSTMKKIHRPKEISSKELNQLVSDILMKGAKETPGKRNPWESDPQDFVEQNLFYKPKGTV
mgnify:CR=1 FL=1